jgi:hypothetical protein
MNKGSNLCPPMRPVKVLQKRLFGLQLENMVGCFVGLLILSEPSEDRINIFYSRIPQGLKNIDGNEATTVRM